MSGEAKRVMRRIGQIADKTQPPYFIGQKCRKCRFAYQSWEDVFVHAGTHSDAQTDAQPPTDKPG